MVDLLAGSITFCGDPLGSPCTQRTIGGFVMSKVQRYSRGFNGEMTKYPFGAWVLVGDAVEREKAAQSDLAALREELADGLSVNKTLNNQCDDLQQRLADAELRNAELADLLHATSSPVVDGELFTMERFQARANARTYLAALKPTKSGASE